MKYKFTVVLFLVIIAIIVATGCVAASEARVTVPTRIHVVWTERWDTTDGQYEHMLSKITIPEDNVTCYISSGYYGSHPACVDGVR